MVAALEQLINGKWKLLAFYSRKLSDPEIKYSAFERELLAIYLATRQFRYILEGRNFNIFTDPAFNKRPMFLDMDILI